MKILYSLTTLFALTLSALGADVKFSALPTATNPSTNSYLPIIDLNLLPAAQNEKYLLTNLATVAQLSSSTNSLTNSFVLKTGDTMTGPLYMTNTGVNSLSIKNYGPLAAANPNNGNDIPVSLYHVGLWLDMVSNQTNAVDFSSWGQYNTNYPTMDLEFGTEGMVFHVLPAGGGTASSSDDRVLLMLRPSAPRNSGSLSTYYGHAQLTTGLFAEQSTNNAYWSSMDNSSNTPFTYWRKSTSNYNWPQFINETATGDAYGMWSQWKKARGTLASPTATLSGDRAMDQSGWAYTGSQWGYLGEFTFEADGNSSSGSTPGRFVVYTTPSGSISPVERMRVSNDGSVTIGGAVSAGQFQSICSSNTLAGGAYTVDFSSLNYNVCVLTGAVTIASSNLATNRNWNGEFWNTQATNCAVTWPSWSFAGGKPTYVEAGQKMFLSARVTLNASDTNVSAVATVTQ